LDPARGIEDIPIDDDRRIVSLVAADHRKDVYR